MSTTTCPSINERITNDRKRGVETGIDAIMFVRGTCPCDECVSRRVARRMMRAAEAARRAQP